MRTEKEIIGKAIEIASHLYNLKQEDVVNGSHEWNYVQCRACIYYSVRMITKQEIGYAEICKYIPRHYTTMVSGVRRISELQKKNKLLKSEKLFLENAEITKKLLLDFIGLKTLNEGI
jgi:chromosomal replication initiation ATPase DnaA